MQLNENETTQLALTEAIEACWTAGDLAYLLHESQETVHDQLRKLDPKIRQRVVFISRRWGKSWLGVIMALEDCLRNQNAQVFICGPTLKHVNSIVVPLVKEITGEASDGLIKRTKTDLRWDFANGSALILGAFDTAIENFRGQRATSIYLEESGLSNPNEYIYILNSVLLPTLLHSKGPITHLTTPSVILDHPLHTLTIPRARLQGAFFEKTVYDNPLITRETIQELMAEVGGEDTIAWQREFLVKLVRDINTVVVPEFNQDIHVRSDIEIPSHVKWTVAGDLGFSRDLSAVCVGFYDFERAMPVIWDAIVLPRGAKTDEIVGYIRELELRWNIKGNNRHIDAEARLLADIRDDHKLHIQLPAKDNAEAQLNRFRIAFGQNNIEIHSRCKHLITTLQSQRWNHNRTDYERTDALGHADSLVAALYWYRMLDKSNPFPIVQRKHDQWQRPEARPEYAIKQVQKALVRHDFLNRRKH